MPTSQQNKRSRASAATDSSQARTRVNEQRAAARAALRGMNENDARYSVGEEDHSQPARLGDIVEATVSTQMEIDKVRSDAAITKAEFEVKLHTAEQKLSRMEDMLNQLLVISLKTQASVGPLSEEAVKDLARSGQPSSRGRDGAPSAKKYRCDYDLMLDFKAMKFDGDYEAYNRRFQSLIDASESHGYESAFTDEYLQVLYLGPLPKGDQRQLERAETSCMEDLYEEASRMYQVQSFEMARQGLMLAAHEK